MLPAVKVPSLNHWTSSEVPLSFFRNYHHGLSGKKSEFEPKAKYHSPSNSLITQKCFLAKHSFQYLPSHCYLSIYQITSFIRSDRGLYLYHCLTDVLHVSVLKYSALSSGLHTWGMMLNQPWRPPLPSHQITQGRMIRV